MVCWLCVRIGLAKLLLLEVLSKTKKRVSYRPGPAAITLELLRVRAVDLDKERHALL